MLAGIAPQVAVKFHKAGKHVSLTGRGQHRWNETAWAICGIANEDNDVCIEIVVGQLSDLENKIYDLTLDSPRYLVLFFRLIYELSRELFNQLVRRLDVDDPRFIKTIGQLVKSQPKERANYKKLARLARRIGGGIGLLGEGFLARLSDESARAK